MIATAHTTGLPRDRESRTDVELLLDTRAGDGESFEALYRRHHAVVLAFIARRVSEAELAADLMAETFAALLVLVRDRDRELPPVTVAWLLLTARHLLIDTYRRGRVEDTARRTLAMRPLVLEDRDLARVLEIAAETDLIARLSDQLTPDQLEALRLRILDEREYSEIASRLRCSESVARKRVSRALRTLRRSKRISFND